MPQRISLLPWLSPPQPLLGCGTLTPHSVSTCACVAAPPASCTARGLAEEPRPLREGSAGAAARTPAHGALPFPSGGRGTGRWRPLGARGGGATPAPALQRPISGGGAPPRGGAANQRRQRVLPPARLGPALPGRLRRPAAEEGAAPLRSAPHPAAMNLPAACPPLLLLLLGALRHGESRGAGEAPQVLVVRLCKPCGAPVRG